MSDQIKTIQVSAEATKVGGTRKRARRGLSGAGDSTGDHSLRVQTRKVEKIGQTGGTSPGTSLQVEASKPLAEGPPRFTNSNSSDLAKSTTDSSPAAVMKTTPATVGGSKAPMKQVKVVLEKSKKKPTRVVLQPAKVKKLPGVPVKSDKTRKVAKKIRMSIHGLNKRVTRANSISKEAKQEPLEKVKKTLIEAKLIKAESKAPEEIIRKMYRDYMMLKNRAL